MPFDEYLRAILVPLLKEPGSLLIATTQDQMGTLLTVQLHQDDMSQVIGKLGETAKAIRTLVRVHGGHNKTRVAVRFAEPDGSYTQRKYVRD